MKKIFIVFFIVCGSVFAGLPLPEGSSIIGSVPATVSVTGASVDSLTCAFDSDGNLSFVKVLIVWTMENGTRKRETLILPPAKASAYLTAAGKDLSQIITDIKAGVAALVVDRLAE